MEHLTDATYVAALTVLTQNRVRVVAGKISVRNDRMRKSARIRVVRDTLKPSSLCHRGAQLAISLNVNRFDQIKAAGVSQEILEQVIFSDRRVIAKGWFFQAIGQPWIIKKIEIPKMM